MPELSKYIEQWENAVDGEETTVSINQVSNLSALLEDVEIAWKALTLPILEPLTTDMLQKVTKIVKGINYLYNNRSIMVTRQSFSEKRLAKFILILLIDLFTRIYFHFQVFEGK